MHPVSQLLFGALSARMTSAPPALNDAVTGEAAGVGAGAFSLALSVEQGPSPLQVAMNGAEMPQLPGLALPVADLESADTIGISELAAVETLSGSYSADPQAAPAAAQTAVSVSGGSGITAVPVTGNGLPPILDPAGKPLPVSQPAPAPSGEMTQAVPGPASDATGGVAAKADVSTAVTARAGTMQTVAEPAAPAAAEPSRSVAADRDAGARYQTDRSSASEARELRASLAPPTAATASADRTTADRTATSPNLVVPSTTARVDGSESATPAAVTQERQAAENTLRAAVNAMAARANEMLPAGADLPRAAGSEVVAARPGGTETALLAAAADGRAAVDPRAVVQDRATQSWSRGHRTEPFRGTEAAADRSVAPGAEGFEQQLRAAAMRTVGPVSVARDIGMLAERIEMLMHRRGDFANLNLSLGDLGDLQISVRMESKQAHISFAVQDAGVRDALEQQLPRLRSLLEQSGVNVGDMNMDLSREPHEHPGERRPAFAALARGVPVSDAVDEPLAVRRSGDGSHIIDAFA